MAGLGLASIGTSSAPNSGYSNDEMDAIINAEYNSTLGRNVDAGSLDLQRQQLRNNPNYDLFGALKQSDEYKTGHQAGALSNASSGLANTSQRDDLAHMVGSGLGGNLGAWTAPGAAGINDADIQKFGAGQQFADAYDSTGKFNPEKFSGFVSGNNTNANDAFLQAYRAGLPGLGNGTSPQAQGALDNKTAVPYGAPSAISHPSVYNPSQGQNFGGLSWYGQTQGSAGLPSFFAQQQGLQSPNPYLYGGQGGQQQQTQPFGGFPGQQSNQMYQTLPQTSQQRTTAIQQVSGPTGFYSAANQSNPNTGLGSAGASSPTFGANSVFASGQPYSAFGGV